MAVCDVCEREMLEPRGCTLEQYDNFTDAVARLRIRYGDEPDNPQPPALCHDCGAPTGELHHPGCDIERCPLCYGQVISCGCSV
jgi:hypothetical protein